MMEFNWLDRVNGLNSMLQDLCVTDDTGKSLGTDEGFALWRERALAIRENSGTVYFVGNGASASMASHFAADIQKNALVHSHVFTDTSLLTAYANDLSYDQVFSAPLAVCMRHGDMLIVISSSGESPNVLAAVQTARARGGYVVTLSAMQPENALRKCGRINFYAPGATYGMAETAHAVLLHFWVDMLVAGMGSSE